MNQWCPKCGNDTCLCAEITEGLYDPRLDVTPDGHTIRRMSPPERRTQTAPGSVLFTLTTLNAKD